MKIGRKLSKHGTGEPMTDLTDLEISKICHKLMGKCYHEFEEPSPSGVCLKCGVDVGYNFKDNCHPMYTVRDSDWADFVFFCVNEWDGWEDFQEHYFGKDVYNITSCDFSQLIGDKRALPTAVALWVRGKEESDG